MLNIFNVYDCTIENSGNHARLYISDEMLIQKNNYLYTK